MNMLILVRTGEMLPSDKEQTISKVTLLPRSTRSKNPNLRRRNEEKKRRRIPFLRSLSIMGERERFKRSIRSSENRVQQVHVQIRWERRVSLAREGSPFPRAQN